MNPSQVAAVIVTRGDVNLNPVLAPLIEAGIGEFVIWDNSRETDMGVYGRYAALDVAGYETVLPRASVIFVQDDDCVLDVASVKAIVTAYRPGHVVCNMPPAWREQRFYHDHALVGFGAVFDRDLPAKAFARYEARHPHGDHALARRRCDVVFTSLTPRILVDVPFTSLPYASGPDRMYRQPEHALERRKVLKLARQAR